jgi:hypothetical protein
MKKLILFFIGLLLLAAIYLFPQTNICNPDPASPGEDAPDDNNSYASTFNGYVPSPSDYVNSECLILNSGYSEEMSFLLDKISNKWAILGTSDSILEIQESPKVFMIPTGGLFSMENDSVFKALLQEYVRLGGTIIVFAQQYGSHIDKVVPIPEGPSLRSYGWREDQSCAGYAGYFKQMHPVLASFSSQTFRGQVSIIKIANCF